MENSMKEMNMEEMDKVAAGLEMGENAKNAWGMFFGTLRNLARAVYKKFASEEN